jgi:hypothetical protein
MKKKISYFKAYQLSYDLALGEWLQSYVIKGITRESFINEKISYHLKEMDKNGR